MLLAVSLGMLVRIAREELREPIRVSMKAELREVARAESTYHARTYAYTADLTFLHGISAFAPPPPGTTLVVERADASAWAARAHDPRTTQTCTFGAGEPLVCQ
ncbi:MAG TPA: hypothetical protein VI139_08170 [Gemmatimonadales bacterium]